MAADWHALNLHGWVTIVALFGRALPATLDDRTPDLEENDRRSFIYGSLGFEAGGQVFVPDPRGVDITLNDRLVVKLLHQPDRTPYIPLMPFVIANAVEIWQRQENGEIRNYYLLPSVIDKDKDGLVVMGGHDDNTPFSIFPFDVKYADSRLRVGKCVYQSYPAGLLCHTDCCSTLLAERKELRALREQTRKLQQQVTKTKFELKALQKEIERLKASGN